MKLTHITFENYKAFQSPQAFNIKPITVIIGKNSAGKSVISRLPVLLARALSPLATDPVEVQFEDLDFGGSFRDLIPNRFAHGNLRFQLVFEDAQKTLDLEVVIQNVADSPLQIIAHFLIKSNEGFLLELNWNMAEPSNPFQTYHANGAIDGEVIVQFKGILPVRIMRPTDESLINDAQLKSLIYEIWTATESINYLGPFRAPPKRTYVHKSSQLTNIGHQGEAAPHILGMKSLVDAKKALVVGNGFAENLGGWKLEISTHQEGFAIVLISPTDSNVKINLMDVGLGINQVLPLVVRGFLGSKNTNGIDIIEQPELHLHPAAHGNLAELIVNTAKHENGRFIIETHSENFILRIRRLIAESQLDCQNVIIYWVNNDEDACTTLKPISIDNEGEVDYWPKGVFTEDYQELIAIRKAQKNSYYK